MTAFILDEKLLQDYSNKFQRHIAAIMIFTRFLESKGYPGCSQFNKLMCDLDRQMKIELVDESFIKKQQEIETNISNLEKIIQIGTNQIISEQLQKLNKQKEALHKDKANKLNTLMFNRIRSLQEALSFEFHDCFINSVPEHNIPVEISAALTLIESQLQYLRLYINIIEKSVIVGNNYMPVIIDALYCIIPYYQFDISECIQQPVLSRIFTKINNNIIGTLSTLATATKGIVASIISRKTDDIFLDVDQFEKKLSILQNYIERFQIVEKNREKLTFILDAKKKYYVRSTISNPSNQQVFAEQLDAIDNFARYLNVNLPGSMDYLYIICKQQSEDCLPGSSTVTSQMQELNQLYVYHLEKHINKAVDLSQLILAIIRKKKLTNVINKQALRDLLKFINVTWEKEWGDLKNKSIGSINKQAILEKMLKNIYISFYRFAYLNDSQQFNVNLLLLEIFSQGFLNSLIIFNFVNNIIKMVVDLELRNISMTKITNIIQMMSAYSLNQLDIILRRTQHYMSASVLRNITSEPLINRSSRKKEVINGETHIRIEEKLFLYSSGGGGHREAKNAKIAEAMLIDKPELTFKPLERDLMIDWVPCNVGKWSTDQWNEAQRRGDVLKQEELVSQQYLADIAFGPFIYQKLYELLESNPQIKEIVDTQAVCNKAVCQAVLEINKKYSRDIKVSLIMTDLPTDKAVHFWNGLRTLSEQERSVIILECMEPLIPENIIKYFSEDESKKSTEFFTMFCGTGLQIVINNQPPIRKEFLPSNHRSKEQINLDGYLSFKYQFSDEKEVLVKVAGSFEEPLGKIVRIPVQANDVVLSVLLGSQGGQAIVDYVKEAINHFENSSSGGKVILCLYCSADKEQSSKLFKEIKKLLDDQSTQINDNLIILPLGIQDALTIAENLERDNLAIIRTGGISSFEALVINQDKQKKQQTKILLHSESKGNTREELLSSIPVWERGNAEYLIHKLNAQVVNTVTFIQEYRCILNPVKYTYVVPPQHELKEKNSSTSTAYEGCHLILQKTYKRKCNFDGEIYNPLKRLRRWFKATPIAGVLFSVLSPAYNRNHLPNMEQVPVPADGNCFYHAVRLYLPDNDDNTIDSLRARVAEYILTNFEMLASFIEIEDMASILKDQEYQNMGITTADDYVLAVIATEPIIKRAWADNIQIIALMHVLERPIYIIDDCNNIRNIHDIESMLAVLDDNRPIFVHYNGYNHYNGLRLVNSQHNDFSRFVA